MKNLSSPEPVKEIKDVIKFCLNYKVLGVGIDAPLSFSLFEDRRGLRSSDRILKEMLPKKAKNWVVSYHTLMAVPLRALLLAEKLSPFCGTILETHPRACFYFSLAEEYKPLAFKYKKENLIAEEVGFILKMFEERFRLKGLIKESVVEGVIDAIFCGLAVYFFHRFPEKLKFLPSEPSATGFGPFVIIEF